MNRFFSCWCVAWFWLGCSEKAAAPAPVQGSEPWVNVRTGGSVPALEVPARVVGGPQAATWITVPLRASVLRVRVRVGDVVAAGAPLIDVVMPELLEAAGRAEGARARLQAWSERLSQLQQLRADGLAKSLDVSEAAAKVAESKADAQSARAVLLAAGVSDAEGARLLTGTGATSLRAPVAGVVTNLTVSVGESREPSGGALAQLASSGPVRVEARFPTEVGDAAGAEFVSAGESIALTLISRAPAADARDGTFLAWFEPARTLPAGVLGRVVVQVKAASELFQVPAKSIVRVEGAARVETRRGAVAIEVVRCEALDCLVRGPLTAGDEVSSP